MASVGSRGFCKVPATVFSFIESLNSVNKEGSAGLNGNCRNGNRIAFAGPSGGCIFQTCRLCPTLGLSMTEFAQHHCRKRLLYHT